MGSVQWFPERLNAALANSFPASLPVVLADAKAHSGTAKAGAEIISTGTNSAELRPTGIGAIREEGARPHVIVAQKGKALYLKTIPAFAADVHHPGSPAFPYLHPAAARWALGGFQGVARRVLAAAGF